MKRNLNIFLAMFGLCSLGMISASESSETNRIHLSELHQKYLQSETELWTKIGQLRDEFKNETNVETLAMRRKSASEAIIAIHKEIFFRDVYESTSYWRTYLLLNFRNLRQCLGALNSTLEENYGFLYDASQERVSFERDQLDQWTRNTMFDQLKASTDCLVEIATNRTEVMEHIKTEAKCCTRYVKYVISEVQLVREFYSNIAKALLRGHAMFQLSHMLLAMNEADDGERHRMIASTERGDYIERSKLFRRSIENMLKEASRDLWKCNPNPYLDNHDYYTSISDFIQGYIDNEVNLNANHECGSTCSDFKSTQNFGCSENTLCAHSNFQSTRCKGEIFDCATIASSGIVCLVREGIESRKYNFLKLSNGTVDGKDLLCFKAEKTELNAWTNERGQECSNCFCYCESGAANSDRYFSLREVTSDIENNKVITGIGLQKKNRVIQFVISERELKSQARVNDTLRRTQPWKFDDFRFIEEGREGIDFFALSRENRRLNLDSLRLPATMVVTGVRFRLRQNGLHMEIRGTEFDFFTGKLINTEKSVWFGNESPAERMKIDLADLDVPTRTTNIQERFDSEKSFVEFGPSGIKKDLAQVTVPYIETVFLEAAEPLPLSGAGIYYKGEPGFGGFVAIKLIAYDIDVLDAMQK